MRARNDSGLTTLEWLLIVAAVAGLAALAVVLVQNVVDDTAEQISGNNARITAAQVAAKSISDDTSDSESDRRAACRRLDITYSSAFDEQPERAAFWSDPDGDASNNGKCFIVDARVKKALEPLTSAPNIAACKTELKKNTFFGSKLPTPAQYGGGKLAWATGASPKCHLVPV